MESNQYWVFDETWTQDGIADTAVSFLLFFPLYALLYLFCPYCSLFLLLWHNISVSNPFWTPHPLSSVCCGCCAVAPTKIEIKNKKNKRNFPKLGKREHNKLIKWIAPDFSRQKALTWREKKEDGKKQIPQWYDDVIFHSITNWGNQLKIFQV